jgi:hypothetical protein
VLVLAVAALASVATSAVPPPQPLPETCSVDDVIYDVDTVELGQPYQSAWLDAGDTATVEWGPQGGQMLVARLRLGGPFLAECMSVDATVKHDGQTIGAFADGLQLERVDATHMASGEVYIELYPEVSAGDQVTLEVRAYETTTTFTLAVP